MNAIPAHVAGVREIVMVVPTPDGVLNELVLAAAHLAGVDYVFTIGGAQAVAALAYGTESVPRVDKIVGPGNIYVATAKRAVFGQVGIDMIAGPSEIMVVSDGQTDPDWLAMDLFSQAEHDEDAQAILVSWDAGHLDAVESAIERLLPTLEREEIVRESLRKRGALVLCQDAQEAITLINRIAPEHLELSVAAPRHGWTISAMPGQSLWGVTPPRRWVITVLGQITCCLPLARRASLHRWGFTISRSALRLFTAPQSGASELGKIASVLARGESLTAHARSAEYRIRD